MQVDQRQQELIPRAVEDEDHDDENGRLGQRHDDAPVDAKAGTAVDPAPHRPVRAKQRHQVLPHRERQPRAAAEKVGTINGKKVSIHEPLEHDKLRNQRDVGRQHHGGEHDQEDDITPPPAQARERKRHQRDRENLTHDAQKP
ncbi:MAG: hypothetical protein R3A10_18545 [Caldilineaceae bacterium]